MEPPKNLKQLRSFLGMLNYLAKFIKNLAEESEILRNLDRKNTEWDWKEEH